MRCTTLRRFGRRTSGGSQAGTPIGLRCYRPQKLSNNSRWKEYEQVCSSRLVHPAVPSSVWPRCSPVELAEAEPGAHFGDPGVATTLEASRAAPFAFADSIPGGPEPPTTEC